METITITPEIDCIAEISTKTNTEEEEIIATEVMAEIIDPITEPAAGPKIETVIETTIGMTIEQITEGAITTKDIAIGTKIVVGLGTEEIEAVPERVPNPGTVPKTDMKPEDKVGITAETGTGLSLDPDPLLK